MAPTSHTLFIFAEGEGERAALPVLIRRIFHDLGIYTWSLCKPFIFHGNPVSRFLNNPDKYVTYSIRSNADAILFVADLEDDCPAAKSYEIRKEFPDSVEVGVAFAVKEIEAWFLAASRSLFDKDCPEPEKYRNAKKKVKECAGLQIYSEIVDMPKYAARMDWREAEENSRSFRHFIAVLKRLTNVAHSRFS